MTNWCQQNYKWAGKERDPETGNDDFGARYYSSVYGRFLSADWSAVPEAVPYANLTNPQTLNLYAIVRDNPESYADLDGHCVEVASCAIEFGAGGSFLGPLGTAGGVILGAAIGGAIVYFGYQAIENHATNDQKNETSNQQTPGRTAQDELARDANGKAVPDAEAAGTAHTQLGTRQSQSKPGTSYPQAREFDANGNPVRDIDFTDHHRPKKHTNPHQHRYHPKTGKRGDPEPLPPGQKPPPAPRPSPTPPPPNHRHTGEMP